MKCRSAKKLVGVHMDNVTDEEVETVLMDGGGCCGGNPEVAPCECCNTIFKFDDLLELHQGEYDNDPVAQALIQKYESGEVCQSCYDKQKVEMGI